MSVLFLWRGLLKNWKLILGGLMLALVLSTVGYLKFQNSSLESQVGDLTKVNEQLETKVKVAMAANLNNSKIIESLSEDAKAKDAILAKYRADVSAEGKKVQALIDYINSITPAENGPLAPVLIRTMIDVQKLQDARRIEKGYSK